MVSIFTLGEIIRYASSSVSSAVVLFTFTVGRTGFDPILRESCIPGPVCRSRERVLRDFGTNLDAVEKYEVPVEHGGFRAAVRASPLEKSYIWCIWWYRRKEFGGLGGGRSGSYNSFGAMTALL